MKKIYTFIFCLLLSSNLIAQTLNEQRKIYAKAVELQEQGLWEQADLQAKKITQYPLAYLLEYKSLKENFNQKSLPSIQAFIKKNAQYKVSNDLQRSYLYYLARNQYWSEFLSFYPQLPNSTDLKCYHFQAKITQGKEAQVLPAVQKLWLTGSSLPAACDSVLQYYLANNKISQQLIWQRFKLTYLKNKGSLSAYLMKLMPDSPNKELAKKLYKINQNPSKLLDSTLFKNKKQAHYPLLLASIKRLIRKDIKLGMQAYEHYDKTIGFNLSEQITLKKYILTRILIREKTELIPWLDKELLHLANTDLLERRIRYAIKLNNWHDIEYWIKQLPSEQKLKNSWLYWQARVLEKKKLQDSADKLYKKIATKRNYYGFLAAQKLNLSYQFNAQIVIDKQKSLDNLNLQLSHIEELHFQQHNNLLKREWSALLQKQNTEIQKQLGLYAYNKGWPYLSVIASIRAKSWDALNIRFPEVKPDLFQYNADKYQLPTSYIYAITRQESSFDESANSPAGAKGYMQLMPATASETAQKIGLNNYKEKSQLTEGKINVQLGSAYFNMLLKRYQGNRVLATAAYNAGPHRVDRWRKTAKAQEALPMDSWIETIPYKETRGYVKNVLAYNVIYQHILEKPLEFLNAKERKVGIQ